MRVFVAGATGVLGRIVVRELVARGYAVTGLARSRANEAILRWLGARPAAADLFDPESLVHAAAGSDVVMHLATAIPTHPRARLRDWRMNDRIRIEGTASLLDAACRVRARLYVQQSVALVHGSAGDNWVDETAPVVPHRVNDSAVTMERLVREASQLHRLPAVILRGGVFYHQEARHTQAMLAGMQDGEFSVIGMGANFWSLIHVEDMARACVLAAETRPAGETFLVVDDEPVRVRDLVTHMARSVGGPPLRYLPPFVARLRVGDLATELATVSLRCRNARLKRQLGWQPRFPTYRDGIAAVLAALDHPGSTETRKAWEARQV